MGGAGATPRWVAIGISTANRKPPAAAPPPPGKPTLAAGPCAANRQTRIACFAQAGSAVGSFDLTSRKSHRAPGLDGRAESGQFRSVRAARPWVPVLELVSLPEPVVELPLV